MSDTNKCNGATTEKSSAVGDAAKLYEVVKELLAAIYDMGIDEETVSIAAKSPNCHMHSVELLSVIKKAKAALSAPPRNCDVMSLAVAKKVWYIKEIMPRLNGDLPLGKEIPFEEWFVAPATEKKGDSDGSK